MTFKKFVFYGLLLWLLLAVTKYIFISYFDTESFLIESSFGFFVVIFSMAMSRRLGVINFLEAMLVAFVWFVMAILLDFLILTHFIDFAFFSKWFIWLSYLLSILAIFFFHKKRHIEIRKEQAHHH
jgi:hypothetical protein